MRPGTTVPPEAIRAADGLRTRLRDGALPCVGLVDVGKGSRLSFELAVRVTLSDLVRFTTWGEAGHEVGPDRWQQLGEDLKRLYRTAVMAGSLRTRM
jgi:hypothetical protein